MVTDSAAGGILTQGQAEQKKPQHQLDIFRAYSQLQKPQGRQMQTVVLKKWINFWSYMLGCLN